MAQAARRKTGSAKRPDGAASQAVKSAERTLEILDLLTTADRPLTFTEIGRALNYPRSSLHSLLHTMADRHWLEAADSGRAYALGIRAWEAGRTYLRAISLADRSLPFMERLRDRLDETVQLAILDGRHNVYVAKATGSQRLILASEVGRRLEAYATGLGKVLLAGLSEDELESRFKGVDMERFTPNTIRNLASLKRELQLIRKRGYGTDNEEYTLGVRCVAAPVRDSSGSVIAAMSVSVPTVRDAVLRKDGPRLLLESADQLSRALGFQGANEP
jgi:DNA-binding IclR family transcriptional regulator